MDQVWTGYFFQMLTFLKNMHSTHRVIIFIILKKKKDEVPIKNYIIIFLKEFQPNSLSSDQYTN